VPSQAATPTIEQTSQDLVQGLSENRPDSSDFADLVTMPLSLRSLHIHTYSPQLLERDGYKCVATGKWSANDTFKHVPVGTTRTFVARTKGAHILRRAVAVFKADSKQANERDNVCSQPVISVPLSSSHLVQCLGFNMGHHQALWGLVGRSNTASGTTHRCSREWNHARRRYS